MANNCGTLLASGLSNCNMRIQNIAGIILSNKGTTYTAAELATVAKTKTNLSSSTAIVALYVPLSGFSITTDEPNISTGALGIKGIFDNQIPSALAYMDRGFPDYKHLWDSNNTLCDIELITKDNYRLMTSSVNGVYKGFRGVVYSPPGLPKTDNPNEAHPIYLFFTDVEEFKNMVILPMDFTRTDIEDCVPVGLDLVASGSDSATKVNVKITNRGGNTGKVGVTTWTPVASNVASAAVSASETGAGIYELTVTKASSPVTLAAGDYVDVQGSIVVSTYVTYITNILRIKGV